MNGRFTPVTADLGQLQGQSDALISSFSYFDGYYPLQLTQAYSEKRLVSHTVLASNTVQGMLLPADHVSSNDPSSFLISKQMQECGWQNEKGSRQSRCRPREDEEVILWRR